MTAQRHGALQLRRMLTSRLGLCPMLVMLVALLTLSPVRVSDALGAMQGNRIFLPVVRKSSQPPSSTGKTYYVDCDAGNDSNAGTDARQAWRSLPRANQAALRPGDALLLKRGCSWTGPLVAAWTGTAALPILISAYGSGPLPLIQNAAYSNVDITGSYQIIEYLQTRTTTAPLDPNCRNQPTGYFVGFNLRYTAAYNLLRYVEATGQTIGVRLAREVHHNQIRNSRFVANRTLQVLDRTPGNDLGAWGILLNGTDNEIADNYLADNNALCSYDFAATGNAIEIYEGQRNQIYRNTALNNKDFSELGGSSSRKADGNVFAYNLVRSEIANSQFLIVRGAGNGYGPTWRTTAYNNTVYFTGVSSQGVICETGCSPDILILKNNILWAEAKAIYADAPFSESNNIYWNSAGNPLVQLLNSRMSATSRTADPRFVDAAANNFRLQPGSPAVDAGSADSVRAGYTVAIDGMSVPQGPAVDIGAFEQRGN